MDLNEILQKKQSLSQQFIMMSPEDLHAFAQNVVKQVLDERNQDSKVEDSLERPLTQQEAANFLQKSRQTLVTWRKAGKIKAHKLGGRIYYKPSELLAALENLSN
jgi:excisionase family DNA binding protein